MSDIIIRQAQCADPIATLAWRLRTDGISQDRVAYAAALGNQTALSVVEPAEWAARAVCRAIEAGIVTFPEVFADLAERLLA